MIYRYNVQDKRMMRKLINSKRFPEYPNIFLSNTCKVKVNGDDSLEKDEFIIQSKNTLLPKKIYLYGKKTRNDEEENNLYINYWLKVFFKTIERGNLYKWDFFKSESKMELTIGLPLKYRLQAFNYKKWDRKDVITFLSCLFNDELEEADYEQQDLFLLDNLQAA